MVHKCMHIPGSLRCDCRLRQSPAAATDKFVVIYIHWYVESQLSLYRGSAGATPTTVVRCGALCVGLWTN